MGKQVGFYRVHNAGKFNDIGPDLYMFKFYRADGSFSSCLCVEEGRAATEREAIIRLGYQPLSERVEA